MLKPEDISQAVDAYRSHQSSLDQFAEWLECVSRHKFAEAPQILEMIQAIDAAYSEYYYSQIGEDALRQELANAIRPFAEARLLEQPAPSGFLVNVTMRGVSG